ncbi:hypothetical protein [Haloarcula laminariae]|uniref:hypothetical protein n=1 Tax=Haloarcula laminariae TaxID=2961577 RepID=UPI0021C80120|nr:hypothetical protein [Halomicroarcula laminariae]
MKRVAKISDFVETSDIETIGEPTDSGFIIIFWLPGADIAGLDRAHDVVIYDANRRPDVHGYMRREEAAEHAVEVAKNKGLPVSEDIYKHTREVSEQGIDGVDW